MAADAPAALELAGGAAVVLVGAGAELVGVAPVVPVGVPAAPAAVGELGLELALELLPSSMRALFNM